MTPTGLVSDILLGIKSIATVITRGDLLHLFRQALTSDSGSIRVPLVDEDEAVRLRRRCYKLRDQLRLEQRRQRLKPLLAYDKSGNPIGLIAVVGSEGTALYEVETPYNCLHFRVIGRHLVIQRLSERLLDERLVCTGALPTAQEMEPDEIAALPPWPLRLIRNRSGRFIDRQIW